ncbi:hypothetical protein JCM4814A_89320 [Streptomyces phaeofaciens JCM 4814]|uniref:Uncharacterized protein n=1 Tax=Streptomyces phaeofaciens TaxID=68254 RepID=A0A918HNI6_9ACTN|nr:hypothetical protein GCM10010226_67780 [Streptomyces phaeofaciens]
MTKTTWASIGWRDTAHTSEKGSTPTHVISVRRRAAGRTAPGPGPIGHVEACRDGYGRQAELGLTFGGVPAERVCHRDGDASGWITGEWTPATPPRQLRVTGREVPRRPGRRMQVSAASAVEVRKE